MRRLFVASSLIVGGLALYGVCDLIGLSAWALRVTVLRAMTAAPRDNVSSRFYSSQMANSNPALLDTGGLGIGEDRWALRTGARTFATPRSLQSFALQVVAIQYGVALGGPSADADADFMSPASQSAPEPGEGSARWQERFFLAAILPPDAFTLRSTLPANAVGTERGAKPSQGTATAPAQYQLASAPEPPRRRPAGRPGSVLNEAQIASIKARLNLTPDQERMWPEVAAALRDISYAKTASAQGRAMAYVDPNSAEVQRLKQVALPLIMRLNGDQMREVKSLAHVMGLDTVAASF
jgi:hypothetical protein